ncbi:MAG: DinB family protein [Candidatus Thorarchaeota archaeon]|nr:MAG: DinB family protein [Candidatus Thorarchaeota archaeon]
MSLIPEWFRGMIIQTHHNQRRHMHRVISGLTEEQMLKRVVTEKDFEDMMSILRHIINAETYWFHKLGQSIGPPSKSQILSEVLEKLSENTQKIVERVEGATEDQLKIVAPRDGGPSVSWAVLRTAQHGVYHTGQIAKLRRVIDAPELLTDDSDRWGHAVDSLIEMLKRFIEEE